MMTESCLSIAVGSKNPAKIRAVQDALEKALLQNNNNAKIKLDLEGFDVSSGVDDQPMSDEETKRGAVNRTKAAFEEYVKKHQHEPHFAVGLEGGLEVQPQNSDNNNNDNDDVWCMAYMAIYGRRSLEVLQLVASKDCSPQNDSDNNKMIWGLGKTGAFLLPPAVSDLVLNHGMELGDADDKIFNRTNSKHGSGTVGVLTNGLISRTYYYDHALILALVPWLRPDVYPHGYQP
mmetsp:Transcript_15146/g.23568  ORF Transcript_15146/g.23568 Transcript_15146/m.23568 type:complete len:233 (+) Transcript_15146:66-764(+)|eukprot:CAMPEP_0195295328 /NCGR_PEP_ID=MMETSP0707-20130614/17122_1 /TAXON_ID=33640 /ORGANISM="Asterionellopsis glacialis, Strain CCMP134" /LENGTH=232 /DNA_ID=CAMNT_0040356527 /DNA_START=56 /DNA_END=754 /DNA_ORIENTATION=+